MALIHVETCAKATQCSFPSYWSGKDTPSQGWSTVPVKDRSTLDLLQACLATDGSQLGQGRDVVEAGRYSRLELALAWRIEHPSLWQRYEIERESITSEIRKRGLRIPELRVRRELYSAAKKLPGELHTNINEVRLLHGTKPETLLAVLTNGLNERFSGGLFGEGSYLAEDAGKNDQYVTSDKRYGQEKQLHECLFREGIRHPEEKIYYIFVCKAVLGHFASTKDGEHALSGSREPVFAGSGKRELATIPGLSPPVHYHALLVETGGKIARYREFIQYHGGRIYPEYLIAYTRR